MPNSADPKAFDAKPFDTKAEARPRRAVQTTGPEAEPWAEEETGPVVTLATLGVAVVVCALLWVARDLFLPLALAMLVTFILTPAVDRLHRLGLPDTAAVVVTVLFASALLAGFTAALGMQIGQIAANLPEYQGNILGKIDAGLSAGQDSQLVAHLRDFVQGLASRMPGAGGEAAQSVTVVESSQPGAWLGSMILPALAPFALAGVIFVTVIFALLEREALRDRLVTLIGGADSPSSARLLEEAGARVSTYLAAQLGVNVVYALPIGIGLWLIGLPNAAFFGMATLVLRFLPYIGSALAAGLPLLMSFAVSPDWSMFLWTAALFATVELLTSNVIEPMVYGQRTGISPLAVVVSALFWAWIWGPLGLIMATPLTVCLVVAGNHVPALRVFAILFGDRRAPEDPRWLYDQLLEGQSPEASPEALLAALGHAQADASAGLLTRAQGRRVARAALAAVDEPPENAPVLAVVAGPARFDQVAARVVIEGQGGTGSTLLTPDEPLPEAAQGLVLVALEGRLGPATRQALARARAARPELPLTRIGPEVTPEARPSAPQAPRADSPLPAG